MGGRSRAAAQFLSGKGFEKVYNLKGGIKAWNGLTAAGPADMAMTLLTGDETPQETIILAYGLETGLGGFYGTMKEKTEDKELADLFTLLGKIEDKHKDQLLEVYLRLDNSVSDRETFESKIARDVMEGGFTTEEFLKHNEHAMGTGADVLNIAMMLEAQALDLYLRFSQKIVDENSRKTLFEIADQEKAHLASLGSLMEKKVQGTIN